MPRWPSQTPDQETASRLARFEAKVSPEPNSGCWLWEGADDKRGYAIFWDGHRSSKAHKWRWEQDHGPTPTGMELDHRVCRIKLCVNPGHLVLCTHLENLSQPDGPIGRFRIDGKCFRGHSLDQQNTYQKPEGGIGCKACRALTGKRWSQKGKTSMTIKVEIRSVYGRDVVYPGCPDSRRFADIARQTTLGTGTLRLIRELGYKIEVVHPIITIAA